VVSTEQGVLLFENRTQHVLYHGDNLRVLKSLDANIVNLVYIDPPFNTGDIQSLNKYQYSDIFQNRQEFLKFLSDRLIEIKRVLTENGSLFLHIDQRESHYCKILLDNIFGEECFMNEIIWAYDYGGRSKSKWSKKHDNIFWYVNDSNNYTFNLDNSDRLEYMAPKLVGEEKAELGKIPTDVWWHTIVHTHGKERTGYPTQKPLGIINRIVKVHSNKGDLLMDCFAGSGSIGEAAVINDRNSILIDINPQAIEVIQKRMNKYTDISVRKFDNERD